MAAHHDTRSAATAAPRSAVVGRPPAKCTGAQHAGRAHHADRDVRAARSPAFGVRLAPALLLAASLFGAGLAPQAAQAQVGPSAAEAAAYTGLHAAAHKGDLAKLRSLLAAGAPLDARDPYGRTPLHVATYARQREALKALAGAGAKLDLLEADRYDAVTIAAVAGDDDTLRVLLGLGASAKLVTSRYDGTALIAAAHLGHEGVVRQLIAAGAPLDHVNNLHWTALIESIVLGDGGARHQGVLQALLDAGASTELADAQGRKPLELAQARGYTAMASRIEAARQRRAATAASGMASPAR